MARPQVALDPNRWLGLWSRLGARKNGRDVFQQLTRAYAEPTRVYHTTAHIADCLEQFDSSRDLARRPDEVEAALWFHDAVYVPGSSNNEELSAQMAQSVLVAGGSRSGAPERVAEMILATRHLGIPSDPDTKLLCDIDLSILGRESAEFDTFEDRIRREYAWVPEPVYRTARAEVLNGFLRRDSIYQTDRFAKLYESRARRNLERALTALAG